MTIKERPADPADVVMFTYYFVDEYYREQHAFINYIDSILEIARDFYELFGNTNWEESDTDWESVTYKFWTTAKKNLSTKL